MAIDARIRELGLKHRNLDHLIDEEARRPAADDLRLGALKRRRLRLKEEMENLRARIH